MFLFSKHYWRMLKRDVPVDEVVEAVLCGDAATRNTACGRLEWLAEDDRIPSRHVESLADVLLAEENQAVMCSLVGILVRMGGEKALRGVDRFVADRARTAMQRRDMEGQLALSNLEACRRHLQPSRPAFHALRFAMLRIVLDPEDTPGRRTRACRVLGDMDPGSLELLDPETRTQLEVAAKVVDGVMGLARLSGRVVYRATLKAVVEAALDARVADALRPAAQVLADRVVDAATSREISYVCVELGNGETISLPDVESIPDTALFGFLEEFVDAVLNPYASAPRPVGPGG